MSEYKITMTDSSELYHHGIQGQKWGVENGPPYPLDASDRSAAEKRAAAKAERKEEKLKKKNAKYTAIATKRMNKREEYVDKKYNVDRKVAKLGTLGNIEKAAEADVTANKIRHLNEAIRNSEDRMVALGKKTKNMRVADITAGTLATGAGVATALAASSAALFALPVATIAGTAYLYNLTTR